MKIVNVLYVINNCSSTTGFCVTISITWMPTGVMVQTALVDAWSMIPSLHLAEMDDDIVDLSISSSAADFENDINQIL